MRCGLSWIAVIALWANLAVHGATAEVLVPETSKWKWLHPTDGTDPASDEDFHTTFFQPDFDDSAWKTGTDKPGPHGGFGYGDADFEGVDIGQPEDPEDRKTAYFRLKFTTDQPYNKLTIQCQRDDGIIVYLDGKEVLRDNVGEGQEAYDLFAERVVSGEEETKLQSHTIETRLDEGEHTLAISLHNRRGGSSDLRLAQISLRAAEESEEDSAEQDRSNGQPE